MAVLVKNMVRASTGETYNKVQSTVANWQRDTIIIGARRTDWKGFLNFNSLNQFVHLSVWKANYTLIVFDLFLKTNCPVYLLFTLLVLQYIILQAAKGWTCLNNYGQSPEAVFFLLKRKIKQANQI